MQSDLLRLGLIRTSILAIGYLEGAVLCIRFDPLDRFGSVADCTAVWRDEQDQ